MTTRTFVTFAFAPAYLENQADTEFCGYLPQGTVDRTEQQFAEVEVTSRDVSQLVIPKGVFRFRFYDRLVTRVETDGAKNACSQELNHSPWHYCGEQADLYTPKPAKKNKDPRRMMVYKAWRKYMRRKCAERLVIVTPDCYTMPGEEVPYVLNKDDVYFATGTLKLTDVLASQRLTQSWLEE